MDDDIYSLHGVASAHSDSGYASTASHGTHSSARQRTRSSTRSTAPAPTVAPTLNARLDRLTRNMASLAHRTPADAGATIGITRKTITRAPAHPTTPRAPLHRATLQEEHVPPPIKRRRTLPLRSAESQHVGTDSLDRGGALQGGEDAPVRLAQIRSPRSGHVRTVARAADEALPVVDTVSGRMLLASFMRDAPSPEQARLKTPDTIFGQRVADFAHLPSALATLPPPDSALDISSLPRFSPATPMHPSSPTSESYSPPSPGADFWKRRPQDQSLHLQAPSLQKQLEGHARYAALLARSAAAQLAPAPPPPATGSAPRGSHPGMPAPLEDGQNRPTGPAASSASPDPPAPAPAPAPVPAPAPASSVCAPALLRTSSREASSSSFSALSASSLPVPHAGADDDEAQPPERAGRALAAPPARTTTARLRSDSAGAAQTSRAADGGAGPSGCVRGALGTARALGGVGVRMVEEEEKEEEKKWREDDGGFEIWEDEDEVEEV
ncbi:hypothetical protein JCM3770_003753 [Rhodotorula araucariae]